MGDFVAFAVTPEREKRFAFSVSIQSNLERTPTRREAARRAFFFITPFSVVKVLDLASRRQN
jgi:hypothetical protein